MIRSLGRITITTGGTPHRCTENETTPTKHYPCQSLLFEQWPGNTGKIYVGTESMVKATGVGVIAILAIPTDNVLPSFSASIPSAPAALNAVNYWVDAEVDGEFVLVLAIRA